MKRYSTSKEISTLVHQLVRDGWQFQRGGQHGKLYAPNRAACLSVPSTPSDWRAFLNFHQDVHRGQPPGLTINAGAMAESRHLCRSASSLLLGVWCASGAVSTVRTRTGQLREALRYKVCSQKQKDF